MPARSIAIAGVLLLATAAFSHAAPFVPTRIAQCVALSADGKLAATGKSGQSNSEFPPRPHPSPRKTGVVHVWDINSGKIVARMETYGDITKVAFSPDGKFIAAARMYQTSDGITLNEVRVWEIATRKTALALDRCHSFDFTQDGEAILVVSRKRSALFSLSTGRILGRLPAVGGATTAAFNRDGTEVVAAFHEGGQYWIRIVNSKSGEISKESRRLPAPFYRVAQSPDGRMFSTGHGRGLILIWDAATLEPVAQLQMAGNTGHQHPFFTSDGSLLGSGSQANGDVVFFDLQTRKEVYRYTYARGTFRTHYPRSTSTAHTPEKDPHRFVCSTDGTSFMAGCHGGIIRVVNSGQQIQQFEE